MQVKVFERVEYKLENSVKEVFVVSENGEKTALEPFLYQPVEFIYNDEGIEEMLGELKQKGYRLAVASSKPEVYVRQILEHFGIHEYFEEIVGSELNGERTRKSEVIEETLKRMKLCGRRKCVLMIGDKEHDVLGAKECGLQCVAVSYGYGTREELEAVSPLKIADSPAEILDFFV